MALTRRQLKEMGLPEEIIETIIAAHAESIAGLKQERDGWREAAGETEAARAERDALQAKVTALTGWQETAARLQGEMDDIRRSEAEAREREVRETAVTEALRQRGANEQVLPLLLAAADLSAVKVTEDSCEGADDLAERLSQRFAPVFAAPVRIPTGCVEPPSAGGLTMTAQELEAMSPEEINNNWQAVKSALMRGV